MSGPNLRISSICGARMVAHQAGTIRRVAATARNMMMSTAALLLALLAPKTVPVTPPPAATQAKDVVASPEGIAKMLAALAVAAPTTSVAKLSIDRLVRSSRGRPSQIVFTFNIHVVGTVPDKRK